MLPTESKNPTQIGFRQIREEGCLSYLLWDRASREAVALDPTFAALGEIRELLQQDGLKLSFVVDTQTHADHPSSSHSLRQETGAKVIMGRGTTSARADRLVGTGDTIAFGNRRLRVLETPGHTPDGICLVLDDDAGNPLLVFTGDTVLIGTTGRTDFPSADPAALHRSLRLLEDELLPQTRIFPAHDYSDLIFSLWGVELKENAQLANRESVSFVALKREESLALLTGEVLKLIEFNLASEPGVPIRAAAGSGVALPNVERVPQIQVQKYVSKLEARGKGELFVDVREEAEFAAGHMRGVESIPLSELAFEWPRLAAAKKIYLSCQSGRRSQMAARTLDRLGLSGVVNVSGGFQAWTNAGFPVEK